MAHNDEDRGPATTSMAYDMMAPRLAKIEAVLGGTEVMRDAGNWLMPKHELEDNRSYNERLNSATLHNILEKTVESLVGRPFGDPVKLIDVPDTISVLTRNIDLKGNNLTTFLRSVFRNGIAKGLTHVMVDMPRRRDPEEDEPVRTLEDDINENLRPYWIAIDPADLIFAERMFINGNEFLVHARIRETVIERAGFEEVVKQRIRQIDPGFVTIWELQKTTRGTKEKWVVIDAFETDFPLVPIATFYTNREDYMVAKPPMADLTDLNIQHWQNSSDQNMIMTVARFPMLAGTGIDDDEDVMEVGPKRMLKASDPQAKFYYVEHSGAAIESGRQALLDLEEKMTIFGADYLRKRKVSGDRTATERVIDSDEETSPLEDDVTRFESFLEELFDITGIWLGIPEDEDKGRIEISRDFGPNIADLGDLEALRDARAARDISHETYLFELKRRDVLDDEFDAEENDAQLAAEKPVVAANTDAIERE